MYVHPPVCAGLGGSEFHLSLRVRVMIDAVLMRAEPLDPEAVEPEAKLTEEAEDTNILGWGTIPFADEKIEEDDDDEENGKGKKKP